MKFIDLARQMEAFFLQKRFLLSCLKPELLLKEENVDLRHEISRKDELIKKHFEKIETWKQLLAEPPGPTFSKPNLPPQPVSQMGMPPMQPNPGMPMGMPVFT
jgi:mediator of RNA polymerase II transcription subunit 28